MVVHVTREHLVFENDFPTCSCLPSGTSRIGSEIEHLTTAFFGVLLAKSMFDQLQEFQFCLTTVFHATSLYIWHCTKNQKMILVTLVHPSYFLSRCFGMPIIVDLTCLSKVIHTAVYEFLSHRLVEVHMCEPSVAVFEAKTPRHTW